MSALEDRFEPDAATCRGRAAAHRPALRPAEPRAALARAGLSGAAAPALRRRRARRLADLRRRLRRGRARPALADRNRLGALQQPLAAALERVDDRSRRSCSATRPRCVIGVLLAMLVSTSRIAERAVYPWLVISQTVPVPAIAPIFVIWTGFDIRPKLMVIALVTFFPIVVNMVDGLQVRRSRAARPAADARGEPLAALPHRAAAGRAAVPLLGAEGGGGASRGRRRVRRVGRLPAAASAI